MLWDLKIVFSNTNSFWLSQDATLIIILFCKIIIKVFRKYLFETNRELYSFSGESMSAADHQCDEIRALSFVIHQFSSIPSLLSRLVVQIRLLCRFSKWWEGWQSKGEDLGSNLGARKLNRSFTKVYLKEILFKRIKFKLLGIQLNSRLNQVGLLGLDR